MYYRQNQCTTSRQGDMDVIMPQVEGTLTDLAAVNLPMEAPPTDDSFELSFLEWPLDMASEFLPVGKVLDLTNNLSSESTTANENEDDDECINPEVNGARYSNASSECGNQVNTDMPTFNYNYHGLLNQTLPSSSKEDYTYFPHLSPPSSVLSDNASEGSQFEQFDYFKYHNPIYEMISPPDSPTTSEADNFQNFINTGDGVLSSNRVPMPHNSESAIDHDEFCNDDGVRYELDEIFPFSLDESTGIFTFDEPNDSNQNKTNPKPNNEESNSLCQLEFQAVNAEVLARKKDILLSKLNSQFNKDHHDVKSDLLLNSLLVNQHTDPSQILLSVENSPTSSRSNSPNDLEENPEMCGNKPLSLPSSDGTLQGW